MNDVTFVVEVDRLQCLRGSVNIHVKQISVIAVEVGRSLAGTVAAMPGENVSSQFLLERAGSDNVWPVCAARRRCRPFSFEKAETLEPINGC